MTLDAPTYCPECKTVNRHSFPPMLAWCANCGTLSMQPDSIFDVKGQSVTPLFWDKWHYEQEDQ